MRDSDHETRTIHADIPVEQVALRRYSLRVVDGVDRGLERVFERPLVFVGTAPDCQFRLTDPTVSRSHARIEFTPIGYRIADEGSKNGVFVSGIRVRDAILPPEAEIVLGETRLWFRMHAESVAIGVAQATRLGGLVGRSLAMREIFAIIQKVAPTDATVLIEGESGTGKELVAEAIHALSPRRDGPFVVFDGSACPRDLIESELFGHVRGAFTGAVRSRIGALEEAAGGTLFLDEVGEIPKEIQPKLLRAIEKREVKPVGGNRFTRVDARILCATNRNLREAVEAGLFREDLYYRIAVIHIEIPPLRKRPEDIALLAEHFLSEVARRERGRPARLSYETMERMKAYSWPGNVRELRNFIERAVILSGSDSGGPLDAPGPRPVAAARPEGPEDAIRVSYDLPYKDAKGQLVREFETRYFARLLGVSRGNVSMAARLAGIHRKSLEYLLRQVEIPRPDAEDADRDDLDA